METRKHLESLEEQFLAPYAARSSESRGREYPVNDCPLRPAYQRDRDRVIHSSAFRKLEYKTQVYVIHEGDYYRTRLTHTMEVAQIARTLARCLRLNSDLAEAVALAHDLGHTPFGHSGEAALHRLMQNHGGFEHNLQGIRIVELLEQRYEDFPGLNLTWEVREGIAKHSTSYDAPKSENYEPEKMAPLESQLVNVADEIAYHHHDLDDALKMGIITFDDLREVPWVAETLQDMRRLKKNLNAEERSFLRYRLIGSLFDRAIRETLTQIAHNIKQANPKTLDDVRKAGKPLVAFDADTRERYHQLSTFLMTNVYRHNHVIRMMRKGEGFIEALFKLYHDTPEILPPHYHRRIPQHGLERVIADYISGMTDNYCLQEYRRAFLP